MEGLRQPCPLSLLFPFLSSTTDFSSAPFLSLLPLPTHCCSDWVCQICPSQETLGCKILMDETQNPAHEKKKKKRIQPMSALTAWFPKFLVPGLPDGQDMRLAISLSLMTWGGSVGARGEEGSSVAAACRGLRKPNPSIS